MDVNADMDVVMYMNLNMSVDMDMDMDMNVDMNMDNCGHWALKACINACLRIFKFPLHPFSPKLGTGLLFLHNQGHNHSNN